MKRLGRSKPEQTAGITPVSPGCPAYLLYRLQPDPRNPIFGKAWLLALVYSREQGLIQGGGRFRGRISSNFAALGIPGSPGDD